MAQRALGEEARRAQREVRPRYRHACVLRGDGHRALGRHAGEAAAREVQRELARGLAGERALRGERGVDLARGHLREDGGIELADAALGRERARASQFQRALRLRERLAAREPRPLHREPPARDARAPVDGEARVGERHRERLRVRRGRGREVARELRRAQRGVPREEIGLCHRELRVELAARPRRLAPRAAAAGERDLEVRRLRAPLRDGEPRRCGGYGQAFLVERARLGVRDPHRAGEEGRARGREIRLDREPRARRGGEGREVHALQLRDEPPQGRLGEGLHGRRARSRKPAVATGERHLEPRERPLRLHRGAPGAFAAFPGDLALCVQCERRGRAQRAARLHLAERGRGARVGEDPRQRPARELEREVAKLRAAARIAQRARAQPVDANLRDHELHRDRERARRLRRLLRGRRRDIDRRGVQACDADLAREKRERRPVERHALGAHATRGRIDRKPARRERTREAAFDRLHRAAREGRRAFQHEPRARRGEEEPARRRAGERERAGRGPGAPEEPAAKARGAGGLGHRRAQKATETENERRTLRSLSP